MKTLGLITEYNPFHNGHAYHIEASKKATGADSVIVVMSGNYVQRGEPAIADKWTRAAIALNNGADLVIELPTYFSTSSAEFFSAASVALLEQTRIVDTLCFGSEVGDLKPLQQIADLLVDEPEPFKKSIQQHTKKGVSYPVAREKALSEFLSSDLKATIVSPNNILGIEYLKALSTISSSIKPYTIKRIGSQYHDTTYTHTLASATSIRQALHHNGDSNHLQTVMPLSAATMISEAYFNHRMPVFYDDFFILLKHVVTLMPPSYMKNILDISEGLENRIITSISSCFTMDELIEKLSTKRYTATRIKRALLHVLLDITYDDFNEYAHHGYSPYIKVLGFKKNQTALMKALKANATLPIIVNVKDAEKKLSYSAIKMLQKEIAMTNVYNNAVFAKYKTILKNDYTHPIIIQ